MGAQGACDFTKGPGADWLIMSTHTDPAELERLRQHTRELSWRRLVERWHAWELEVSIATDAYASTCVVVVLPLVFYLTRDLSEGRGAAVVCTSLAMAAGVAHLLILHSHKLWYSASRDLLIIALRVVLVGLTTAAWALSDWYLTRSQEIASRVLFGLFLNLGYTLPGSTQLTLQTLILFCIRLVLGHVRSGVCASARCSVLGICRNVVNGVVVGHISLWEPDVPMSESVKEPSLVPFAYSFDGFLFDALCLVIFPTAVAYVQRRMREVMFSDEETRRETQGTGNGGRDGRDVGEARDGELNRLTHTEGLMDSNAAEPQNFTSRAWRAWHVLVPLMEFPDDALEKRFRVWHARSLLRVDTTRAAISCLTAVLWYIRLVTAAESARGGAVFFQRLLFFRRLGVTMFTSHCYNLYLILGHTEWYVRHRVLVTSLVRVSIVTALGFTWYYLAGLNCVILNQKMLTDLHSVPSGVREQLRDWVARYGWVLPTVDKDAPDMAAKRRSPSSLVDGGKSSGLFIVPYELRLVHFVMQIAGTHQLMRVNVLFTLVYVVCVCVVEPLLITPAPFISWAVSTRLSFLPEKFSRPTACWLDVFFLLTVGFLMERYFRRAFARDINLELRQILFMRSPLARLRLMGGIELPPRPLSQTEDLELLETQRRTEVLRARGDATADGAGGDLRRRNRRPR